MPGNIRRIYESRYIFRKRTDRDSGASFGKNITDFKVGERVYPYPLYAKDDTRRAGTIDLLHMTYAQQSLIGSGGYIHIAFSLGSKEAVDELTETLRSDGYDVISGPRTTGDGYYESCIVAVEGNQIEITE